MRQGKLPCRYRQILQMEAAKTERERSKALVEYYRLGGSTDNIIKIVEGKGLEIHTFRDFSDRLALLASERSNIHECYADIKSKSAVVVCEGITRNQIGEIANTMQTELTVVEGKRRTTLIARYQGAIRESMETPDRFANEQGIFYEDARRECKSKSKEKVFFCPSCGSTNLKVESSGFLCWTCNFKDKQFLPPRSHGKCSACGSLIESKKKPCRTCGKVETMVASQVAPTNAKSQGENLLPGSCPKCGGTTANVGDTWRCLSCGENVTPVQFGTDDKPKKAVYVVKPGEAVSQSLESVTYRMQDGSRLVVEQGAVDVLPGQPLDMQPDDEIERDQDLEPVQKTGPSVLNEYVVMVNSKDQDEGRNAYKLLLDNGYLVPGTAVMQTNEAGQWTEVEGDPNQGKFMVSVADEAMAKSIHDALLANGYESEIGAFENPQKKEKMGYPGYSGNQHQTFDYSNPGAQVGSPAAESANPDSLQIQENLSQHMDLDFINRNLSSKGFGRVTRNQLTLLAHLYSKKASTEEMTSKTGVSSAAISVIIG